MTQPLPSSSRKRALSDDPPANGSLPKKKKRIDAKDDGTDRNSSAPSRDKKKRKKKKRRLSVTTQGDGHATSDSARVTSVNVGDDIGRNADDGDSASVVNAGNGSPRISDAQIAHSRDARSSVSARLMRTHAHKQRLKMSAKAKGKQKTTKPTSEIGHQLQVDHANGDGEADTSEAGPSNQAGSDGSASIIARLMRELEENKKLLAAHNSTLTSLSNSLTCQICIDLMHKPFLLTPCGHLACYNCLVRWFTEPRDGDGTPAAPSAPPPPPRINGAGGDATGPPRSVDLAPLRRANYIRRPKTCPHCRARIRSRPVEVYGLKSMVSALAGSGLVSGFTSLPEGADEDNGRPEASGSRQGPDITQTIASSSRRSSQDPWAGIFPPEPTYGDFFGQGGFLNVNAHGLIFNTRRARQDVDSDVSQDGDRNGATTEPVAESLETHGFHDREDGVYRCTACMHEIWDGVCSNDECGQTYTGHAARGGAGGIPQWFGGDTDVDEDDEEENRIFNDMLRAQFGLDDDEDSDDGVLYADFTDSDEADNGRPDRDANTNGAPVPPADVPVDVNHPQYRAGHSAGYITGHDDGYNEGYDEGFEEGLEEGQYQTAYNSRGRNRGVASHRGDNDDDDEEGDDDSYEGSFIDDGEDYNGNYAGHDDEDSDGDDEVEFVSASRRNRRGRGVVFSDEEGGETLQEDEDQDGDQEAVSDDDGDDAPVTRPRRRALVSTSSDAGSE